MGWRGVVFFTKAKSICFFINGMVANTTDFDHLVSPTTTSLVFNGSNPRITEETEAKNDFISISCIWKICVS